MIIINPEFHRHLWLNFSPFRLIAMPVLLALVLYAFSNRDTQVWQISIFLPALYTYFIVVFLWGNYEAASASNNDIGGNTWDFQKMSCLTPNDLLIGKLFGATSYIWYAGLMLLGVIAYSYSFMADVKGFESFHEAYPTPIKPLIYLLFAGVMGQSAAFLCGTHNLKQKKPSIAAPFIIGLIVSFTVISFTVGTGLNELPIQNGKNISWHFLTVGENTFLIASLLFFFSWIMIAIHRNLREELQYKNSPIFLMMFLITISLYVTGYLDNIHRYDEITLWKQITSKLFFSFFIIIFVTYLTVFIDASNLAKYKRWIYAIKTKEWKRVFENTPAWIGCAILLIPTYILANLGTAEVIEKINAHHDEKFSILPLTSALILFTLRDGLVYHSILLGKIERHKAFLLALYLFLIYALLPLLTMTFTKTIIGTTWASPPQTQQIMFDVLLVFYPIGGSSIITGCVPVLIQSFIAFIILRYVIKSLKI